ncbi:MULTISPECIES: hypothetical protein [unclassified Mesorhizobium]|nr:MULTISPECIES: hypothetical protein [unclassified Mesorhizobium]
MENLKSVLQAWIQSGIDKLNAAKPYAITAGIAYVAGLLTHWIF